MVQIPPLSSGIKVLCGFSCGGQIFPAKERCRGAGVLWQQTRGVWAYEKGFGGEGDFRVF